MKAHYFFNDKAFHEMPFGATTSNQKMFSYADIVVRGHKVIKHRQQRVDDYEVTDAEIKQMKADFDGVVVSADCL